MTASDRVSRRAAQRGHFFNALGWLCFAAVVGFATLAGANPEEPPEAKPPVLNPPEAKSPAAGAETRGSAVPVRVEFEVWRLALAGDASQAAPDPGLPEGEDASAALRERLLAQKATRLVHVQATTAAGTPLQLDDKREVATKVPARKMHGGGARHGFGGFQSVRSEVKLTTHLREDGSLATQYQVQLERQLRRAQAEESSVFPQDRLHARIAGTMPAPSGAWRAVQLHSDVGEPLVLIVRVTTR